MDTIQILSKGASKEVDQALALLAREDPTAKHIVIRCLAQSSSSGEDPFLWLDLWQHDVEAAIRGMRFLSSKVSPLYNPGEARDQRVLASIDKHLRTLEDLRDALLSPILQQASVPNDK